MTDRELMQQALETAEQIASADYRHWGELASLGEFERWARSRANHIAEALRARLAQPEQEPVAYVKTVIEALYENSDPVSVEAAELLEQITTLPQREWVGLTDDEIEEGLKQSWVTEQAWQSAVWWAEAKLKEKNGY